MPDVLIEHRGIIFKSRISMQNSSLDTANSYRRFEHNTLLRNVCICHSLRRNISGKLNYFVLIFPCNISVSSLTARRMEKRGPGMMKEYFVKYSLRCLFEWVNAERLYEWIQGSYRNWELERISYVTV
jgi:hypothetical protein